MNLKKLIQLGIVLALFSFVSRGLADGILVTEMDAGKEDLALIEKLKADYSAKDVCVVSDEKIGGEMGKGINCLYKSKMDGKEVVRLVRFCCKGCIKDFKKDPEKYLKKIDSFKKS